MTSMKGWVIGSLAVLLAVGMLLPAGTFQPAWANSELHLGARIVVPGWDVRGNRETYIVLTREDLTTGNAPINIVNSAGTTIGIKYTDPFDNCRPRGLRYSDAYPLPSGIGNTEKVLVADDVHVEYYGKSCANSSEVIRMSCGDIDLLLLSDDPATMRPGFAGVAFDGVGAADINYIINGTGPDARDRKDENSLMGTVIIADVAEGWAAVYPAASAKSTTCLICEELQGNTDVGYEPFPQEVFLPMAFAEGTFQLSNLLFLFSPNLFPGEALDPPTFDVNIRIWDGRERWIEFDRSSHLLVRTLGDPFQSGQDVAASLFPPFQASSFICGHTPGNIGALSIVFENDGAPRGGTSALACGPNSSIVADTEHQSDNFDFQTSNPISWWRFELQRRGELPNFPANLGSLTDNSGRGLVGVLLSTTFPGPKFTGVGDATRLWHKDPCEIAQSSHNFGPPHVRDASLFIIDAAVASLGGPNGIGGSVMAIFNALTLENQAFVCELPTLVKRCFSGAGASEACLLGGDIGGFVGNFTAP